MKNVLKLNLLLILLGFLTTSCEVPFLEEQGDTANSSFAPGASVQPDQVTLLSQIKKKQDGNLVVTAGTVVTIDTNLDAKRLIVNGTLQCPNTNDTYRLKLENLHITGSFICGTASERFEGKLEILLKPSSMMGMMNRSISIVPGGNLILHGRQLSSQWQKINSNILAGESRASLSESTNWQVGDKVVVSSSSFDMNEAETFEITNISGTDMRLDRAASYFHSGSVMNIVGKEVDERSVIANLTRNIEIKSYGVDHLETQLGGHIMNMGGFTQIDSVSLDSLGRMGELGRYPFHWHLSGNVRGQYIKNSSITNSYQRCVVIHKTDEALVKGNVCYNHFGHGYFLEHGSERNNIILENLALVAKRPFIGRFLLKSDSGGPRGRFAGPASYWISNPDNIVANNLAAGSEGSGFWMSFVNFDVCDISNPCAKPSETNTLIFRDNAAHSSRIGITWDGAMPSENEPLATLVNAHYKPTEKAVFENLTAYKNSEAGIYFRGDAATFDKTTLADNFWGAFFAYSQELKSSTIVGQSENMRANDKAFLASYYTNIKKAGIVIYDGPFELNGVDFLNFPSSEDFFSGINITPTPILSIGGANRYENKSRGLTFSPEPVRRVLMMHGEDNEWIDSSYSQSIRDLDGSLTGVANSLVVPSNPINDRHGCTERESWNAFVCEDYRTGLFKFKNAEATPRNIYFIFDRLVQG